MRRVLWRCWRGVSGRGVRDWALVLICFVVRRWGSSESDLSGSLSSWSVIDRLHKISHPTLVINGIEDEAQGECVYPFFEKLSKVKWVRFDKSSHLPLREERERYFEVVAGSLKG